MIIVKLFQHENVVSENEQIESAQEFYSGIVNWQLASNNNIWTPPCDFLETNDSYIVRVEVAGMNEKDFEITAYHHRLKIHGRRFDNSDFTTFHQMEIYFGDFNIELDLPSNILLDKASAEYCNGFLLITLPKSKPINVPISGID